MSIITLLTDFGLNNWFVGTMKGVIKNINPDAEIIDISHNVNNFNVCEAAFTLRNSYIYFPVNTVHTVVVDPGVGSKRNALLVKTEKYFFVAPDNGVLSYCLDCEEIEKIIRIENSKYFLIPESSTFHGRDIFAPVSAYLSSGVDPDEFGPEIKSYKKLKKSVPRKISEREIIGHIIHIDQFGNLITDVPESYLNELFALQKTNYFKILIRDYEIRKIAKNYSEGKGSELIALVGSSGYLEIAVNQGSAKEVLDFTEGGEFIIKVI